jgi:hypothetical protein
LGKRYVSQVRRSAWAHVSAATPTYELHVHADILVGLTQGRRLGRDHPRTRNLLNIIGVGVGLQLERGQHVDFSVLKKVGRGKSAAGLGETVRVTSSQIRLGPCGRGYFNTRIACTC